MWSYNRQCPSMTGWANGFPQKNLWRCWRTRCSGKSLNYSPRDLAFAFADGTQKNFKCANYIRERGLNHRQFKASLEYLNCDHRDAMYFSAVHWLSRAATLMRFLNMRQEIRLFTESKHQNVAFLRDENWLNDLALLTYITQHLSELNLKLQGKLRL